jgi:hypothetical protein
LKLSCLVSPIDLKPRALLVPNGDDEISTCEKIIEKLKAYLPTGWESMLEDSKALSEIAGGDPGLITASKDLLAMAFQGGVKGTTSLGTENHGIGTWRVQLSGGRLIAMANVNECLQHFRTTNINEAKQCLSQMDASTMPDALALPSLYFVYLRTGDCLLTPSGVLMVDKVVGDHSIALRLGIRQYLDLNLTYPLPELSALLHLTFTLFYIWLLSQDQHALAFGRGGTGHQDNCISDFSGGEILTVCDTV